MDCAFWIQQLPQMVEKNEESVAALTIYNLQSARGYFFLNY